jgi:hypothetical protein
VLDLHRWRFLRGGIAFRKIEVQRVVVFESAPAFMRLHTRGDLFAPGSVAPGSISCRPELGRSFGERGA